jgi:hypothetical protein
MIKNRKIREKEKLNEDANEMGRRSVIVVEIETTMVKETKWPLIIKIIIKTIKIEP